MGLLKYAKISGKKLVDLLEGETPFFHMSDVENLDNLERRGVVSPLEAKSRGLLTHVESLNTGTRRFPVEDVLMPSAHEPLIYHQGYKARGSGVILPLDKNLRRVTGYAPHTTRAIQRALAHPDPRVSDVLQQFVVHSGPNAIPLSGLKIPEVAGKNWAGIALSDEPARAYGDIGVMTRRKEMRGRLHKGQGPRMVDNVEIPQEYQLGPRPHYGLDEEGKMIVKNLETPTARGTIVYDPQKVDRETAKRLKGRGGIALNARLRRKLKGLIKAEKLVMPRALDVESALRGELEDEILTKIQRLGVDFHENLGEAARISRREPLPPISPKPPKPKPTGPTGPTGLLRLVDTAVPPPPRSNWWSRLPPKRKALGAFGAVGGLGALGTYLYHRNQGQAA